MNKDLYNCLVNSISNEIRNTIEEQFNIGGMDLNNKQKMNKNIFNKNTIDVNEIYDRLLIKKMTNDDIQELNTFTSVIKPKDKNELRKIIYIYMFLYPEDSLNWLDVSDFTDMSKLFSFLYTDSNGYISTENKYNGDISRWDVSNVTNMSHMFESTYFNNDISEWDVSNVTNMFGMFVSSKFNQNISRWDVSNVTDMACMFAHSKFNQDISEWDVSNVMNMSSMFYDSNFNYNISKWDVSNVKNMNNMFAFSKYNKDISKWKLSDDIACYDMFMRCPIRKKYMPYIPVE